MTDALSRLLSQRGWLMADGATGTNLFNMGLESGEPPEFWNSDRPDNIRSLYRGSVEFAAPMIYALGFIGLFTIGGLTGLFLATLGFDVHVPHRVLEIIAISTVDTPPMAESRAW